MSTERKSAAAPLLVSFAIVLALLAGYTAAYLTRSRSTTMVFWTEGMRDAKFKVFRSKPEALLFAPALWIESKIRGERLGSMVEKGP